LVPPGKALEDVGRTPELNRCRPQICLIQKVGELCLFLDDQAQGKRWRIALIRSFGRIDDLSQRRGTSPETHPNYAFTAAKLRDPDRGLAINLRRIRDQRTKETGQWGTFMDSEPSLHENSSAA
jgi:hypothetical protein